MSGIDDRGADRVIEAQGAALIAELVRLQKALDFERSQKPEPIMPCLELFPSERRLRDQRDSRRWPTRRTVRDAVDLCLGVFGFRRRKALCRTNAPESYDDEAKLGWWPAYQDDNENVWHRKSERPSRGVKPLTIATSGGHSESVLSTASDVWLRSAGEGRNKLHAVVNVIGTHLWSGCAFLFGYTTNVHVQPLADAELATGLSRAFESQLRAGLRVLITSVGVLGGCATLIPLSGAVIVPATLVVESSVKKIQHPAGGVVARIPVHDGMHVQAGDLVLQLDETQVKANYQVLMQQLAQIRAREARLIAERDGQAEPKFPQDMTGLGDDTTKQLWASEMSLFKSRAVAHQSAKELLLGRIEQLKEQISGLEAQAKSKAEQRELIAQELEGVEKLYRQGLVPLTRKTALEREASRLNGDRGQTLAAIAEARSKMGETKLQIVRLDQDLRTEVMKDLREMQDKEAELVEKNVAARDLLKRVDLRAPANGIIHQLVVHTIGGVVTPGEVIMEIVPESDDLQIEAKLPSRDIDQVHPGQTVYVRFSAFNQRTTPQLEGVVAYVSADLAHDQQTNTAYYTVRVTLRDSERRRLGNLQLISGMPSEVFLQTGTRTIMSYLFKPISDQMMRTFREP